MSDENVVAKFKLVRGTDTLQVDVLADGRAKVTVEGSISAPNHVNADQLLKLFQESMGGTTEVKKLRGTHSHQHAAGKITHSH